MLALIKKEIISFFTSFTAVLVIGFFLLVNGLFLWVFRGSFNIFDAGYADLSLFFTLAPWVLIFLIPVISMRSFSEEKRSGTIVLLLTKPLTLWQLVIGKYISCLFLVVLTLIPTTLYVYTIYELHIPGVALDWGGIAGSYIGLLFLCGACTAISLFMSVLTKNQVAAFISAVFSLFFMYYGIDALADYSIFGNLDYVLANIGMQEHFRSMSIGVLDSRDLIYFMSISFFFLWVTREKLQNEDINF